VIPAFGLLRGIEELEGVLLAAFQELVRVDSCGVDGASGAVTPAYSIHVHRDLFYVELPTEISQSLDSAHQ